MISPKLIELIFSSASIQRWNDYPRMMELTELDKQAHKFIIAYFVASLQKQKDPSISMLNLIEAGIFEFLRRVIVTDIRPDVFHEVLQKKEKELNNWVIKKLTPYMKDIQDGEFLTRFTAYLKDENIHKKERHILKASSYMATKWEFEIVYHTSSFLKDIEDVKKSVEDEIEDYYDLIGIRKISLNKKLSRIIDLSGRLRFQKRWAQTPRLPDTSVLGHMLFVSIISYFYSIQTKSCEQKIINNFFTALFHDLPEALTRDIISPVKYSVPGIDEILSEFEMAKMQDNILSNTPHELKDEFSYYLGIYHGKKDEFLNKTYEKEIKIVDDLKEYNEDKYNPIDGKMLKACDRISAFIEASISISHGIKSSELVRGKEQILQALKENQNAYDINFYQLALNIDEYFQK